LDVQRGAQESGFRSSAYSEYSDLSKNQSSLGDQLLLMYANNGVGIGGKLERAHIIG